MNSEGQAVTTPTCTCTISAKEVIKIAVIGFCPLHKAAPALLEALEGVKYGSCWCGSDQGINVGSAPSRGLRNGGHWHGCLTAEAAIKLAKGETP